MEEKIEINAIYKPSEDVVAREVQGEFIIIPITSGVADVEDELFSLNDTGKAIWNKLDGKKKLNDIVDELSREFEAPHEDLQKDVLGLAKELLNRKMIIEATKD